jgi:hyperosmotically inducible periplasmic protein
MRSMRHGGAVLAGTLLLATSALATPPDAWITAKTKMALLTTEGVSGTAINVDTVDGNVTLHGRVSSAAEKTKAETEAKKIDGVHEVRNMLQVVPQSAEKLVKASDSELKDRVQKALKDDPQLRTSSVAVQSVNDGVVLLSGATDTVTAHLTAIEDAARVPGVRRVASEIESPDKLADREIQKERAEAGAKRTMRDTAGDMYITSATKLRLMANEQTPSRDISVDTRNGVVTLFGTAPSKESKAAAEAEARKVSGVNKVVNELEVVPASKKNAVDAKDDDVEKVIDDALSKRDDLRGSNIDVEVANGVARLTGTVDNEQQRLSAAIAARSTPGVKAVKEELRISSN